MPPTSPSCSPALVTPIVMFIGAVLYVFVISQMEKSLPIKIGICVGVAYLGLQAPMIFLKNAISKRQLQIKRAFPDALDLLLICIESGMSVEVAFRKVAAEIVQQSVALSEEFALTTAELSYLQDRRMAYDNLATRTGLEGVKSVCLALTQSERYGTPLGQSLRVMAQENRDMRMNGGREEGRRAAAETDRADDPVLPAGAVRGHPRADRHQGRRDAVMRAAAGVNAAPVLLNQDCLARLDRAIQYAAASRFYR